MVKRLLVDGLVSEEEAEIVSYGLESLKNNLTGFFLIVLAGICLNCFPESIVLGLMTFPLRKNAGGYHAKTRVKCTILSVVMVVMVLEGIVKACWPEKVYILVMLVCAGVIMILAPVENSNKRLDGLEKKVYRQRTRKILVAEIMLFLLASVLEWNRLAAVIAAGFLLISVSLIVGWIKLKK